MRGTLFALLLTLSLPAPAVWVSADESIMGTNIYVELWHEDEAVANEGVQRVFAELRRIDAAMSPYKEDSELSRINRDATDAPVAISEELAALIERALKLSVWTDGAFDITYASVGHLYNYREGVKPDEATREAARQAIDYRHVELDKANHRIRFARPGVVIDLGGIAKGYAVERCVALLRERGFQHALVSAGGDTRLLGDRRGTPWLVGIRHPRADDKLITRIPVADEAVSTSGDYERFFEQDGVRYHHIIQPSTGDSAREVQSVTIIGPDATMTDGLSTSVFVMGPVKGLGLINRMEGFEAVIVDRDGKLHLSRGLAPPEAD